MKKSGFTHTLILSSFRFFKTVFTNSNMFSKIQFPHKAHSETKKQRQDWCRGFSYVELVLVVGIIGIISGVIVASLNSARNKGGATVIRTQLAQIRTTLQQHFYDTGVFPPLTATSPYNTGLPPTMGYIFRWYEVDGTPGTCTPNPCFDAVVKNSFASIKGQINTNAGSNLNTIYYEINEKETGKLGFTIGVFGRDGNFISVTENSSKTLTSGVTGRAVGTQNSIAGTISSITTAIDALILDNTPTSLPFADQTGVNITTLTLSNIIEITGINAEVAVSISTGGPQFRICSSASSVSNCASEVVSWGSDPTTITSGQYLQLRLTSSWGGNTAVPATILVGTSSDTWSVTTLLPFSATGGTVTMSGGFAIHTFVTVGNDTFTPNVSGNVEVLVVAGGGGGGGGQQSPGGGGGGAGGLISNSAFAVTATGLTVTVGGAGTAGISDSTGGGYVRAGNGGNSVFASITATGGGGGGVYNGIAGQNGGSGGGTNGWGTPAGTGISGQGNNGGPVSTGSSQNASGGGGAGAVGGTGSQTLNVSAGAGGVGLASSISGTSVFYAGGGGGGSGYNEDVANTSARAAGGSGGGGEGGRNFNPNAEGIRATSNTGGGGGGAGGLIVGNETANGGAGGSGIVIIRYPATSFVDLTKVRLSTVTQSNIIQISGITASTPVSITTANSAQFRICSDSTCTSSPGSFVTSATINDGQWLQLQLTSSASVSALLSTTITVGGGTDIWSVTTAPFFATGGTTTTSGGFTIHTFTSSGTFTLGVNSANVEYLVVAGGGGGGRAGGGGGGGIVARSSFSMSAGAHTVIVGAGGRGHTADGSTNLAETGGDSIFSILTAKGGGAGSNCSTVHTRDGGSGGGAGFCGGSVATTFGIAIQPTQAGDSGAFGFGFNGGTGFATGGNGAGGGGGGAGAVGANGTSLTLGANGGSGRASSITGSSIFYAGGGGSSSHGAGSGGGGLGGAGGGGRGNDNSGTFLNFGVPAVANTGGGGAGWHSGGAFVAAMNGGSGIVIVRYTTPSPNF